jgi:hypothetical protein
VQEVDNTPRYVRLCPRASLAAILDERADQALPDKVNGLVSKVMTETLNRRPNILVNVTPATAPQTRPFNAARSRAVCRPR